MLAVNVLVWNMISYFLLVQAGVAFILKLLFVCLQLRCLRGLVLTNRSYAIDMPIACITTVGSLSISLRLGSRLYGALLAALKWSELLNSGELRCGARSNASLSQI